MRSIRETSKKYLVLLMVCAMVAGLFPRGVYAASPFTFDEGTKTITGYDVALGGTDVVIPENINGVAVERIGDNAFLGKGLISVTIPDSVITIGRFTFRGNMLTSVVIPNSVTEIGMCAFDQNKLANVTLSNSVATIENYAFDNNELESIVIPNSVTTIGIAAFRFNTISSVIIPNSVTIIGREAFSHNKLGNVTLPNSVAVIGDYAFNENKLENIVIPNSVAVIGDYAFNDNKLENIVIPNSVTTIGFAAFRSNMLTSITMERVDTIIGDYLLTVNHDFRDVYYLGGIGTYTGTQEGTWTNIGVLNDAEKVDLVKTAIETAFSNLAVSNATTANEILTAANGATLHGVTVTWDSTNGFSKTDATSSGTGTITGTLNLTLNSATDTVSVNKAIAQLPLSDAEKVAEAKTAIETAISTLAVSNATTANEILTAANGATLHGVTVAWDGTNGFNKTDATSSTQGSITGTFKLTLNGEIQTISISKIIAQLPVSDAEKVAAAKTAIEAALSSLAISNTTTDNNILTAATNATLHGVTVAWDGTNGYNKTDSTRIGTGSITGTLNLTLNSANDTVSVNKIIAQLPLSDDETTPDETTPDETTPDEPITDETTSTAPVTETVNGGQLPKTSTGMYKLILIGAGFILIGAVGWTNRKRYE